MRSIVLLASLFVVSCTASDPGETGGGDSAASGDPYEGMARVRGGTYLRGCTLGSSCSGSPYSTSRPSQEVTIDSFAIDLTEVTQGQYAACVDAGGCSEPRDAGSDYDPISRTNFPVIHTDWHQASAYCEWKGGRLPTEAEWEMAARGNDGRTFSWGEDWPTCERANFDECGGLLREVAGTDLGETPFGLRDMAGNAWEWVADWYEDDYYASSPSDNPQGPSSGTYKSLRGSHFGSTWQHMVVFVRDGLRPDQANEKIGFRCAEDDE